MEAENGIKVVYPNSLNIVYSKSKDKFFLCNLQNILMEREFQKIQEIEKSTVCDIQPNTFFMSIFPQLEKLYINDSIRKFIDLNCEFSLSIVGM